MMKRFIQKGCAVVLSGLLMTAPISVQAGGGHSEKPPEQDWSFYGALGTFDRASAQRGFQVYKEVCSGCHGLELLSYRNLMDIGYSEEEVKAIASEYTVMDGPNDEGEMYERAAIPSDGFVGPYANEKEARVANNGALPPDLSLITKARMNGPDYLYALLTGYEEAPYDMEMQEGMSYNKYFPSHQIAMAQPIYEGSVDYADGTEATIEQMSYDVVTFLHWAAEPKLEERHRMGVRVMLFLFVLTVMLYFLNKRIWSRVKKK